MQLFAANEEMITLNRK